MMILKRCCWAMVLFFPIFCVASADAQPPIPLRIGGSVTLEGKRLTQQDVGNDFHVIVTRPDGTPYVPKAESFGGLNPSGNYLINMPIYDPDLQPGGSIPGETALLHVFGFGKEFNVISPEGGKFVVGRGGSTQRIDLVINATP